MALRILDDPTRAACNAATTQQGQCEALIEPWDGGNVTARLFAPDGTTLLRTLTLGPFTINSSTPRGVVAAAHLADTHIATGTPGLWVFRVGSTDIFSIDAGTSGASVNHAGNVLELCTPTLAGVVFTAQSSLPVSPSPYDEALDLIAAAHADGQMWARIDNGVDTFEAAWPEADYRDPNANYAAILYAWAGCAVKDDGLITDGSGHANGSSNEPFFFSFATRGWELMFYGSEHINVWPTGGRNTHRVKGFNDAATARHPYCNPAWLPVLGRYLNFGGAAWNDGNVLRVFDDGISGDQEGLRIMGAYTLDVTLAGQGYTLGATGTNYGPSLPGANAYEARDWLAPGHASPPIFGGNTYATHIDRGVAMVRTETSVTSGLPVDVAIYTAGSTYGLLRTEFHPDPDDDVTTLICSGLDFNNTDGEVLSGGNIAGDPDDDVVVALARGNSSFQPFRFVDLLAGTPAWTEPTSPTGAVSDLKSESKGEPGLLWDPIDGCYVAATRGSSGTPGVFPESVYRIFKPARSGGFTPAAGWSVDLRTTPVDGDSPPAGPFTGGFVTVTGTWRWANSLRCGLFLTDPTVGQVWAYIPENWTDPR